MKRINKDIIFAKIKENYLVLLFNLIVLSFLAGSNIASYQKFNISMWDFVLLNLTDHYYVLYCMIISVIIMISRDIKDINYTEKIRYKNVYAYNLSKIRHFLVFLSLYFLAHLIILTLIGALNFKASTKLSPITVDGYNEIIDLYNSYVNIFDNIIVAILALTLYLIFGFTLLYALLTQLNQKKGYKNTIIGAIIIYVLAYIGFKSNLKTLIPVLFLNNYILLHHGLMVNGLFKFILVVLTGILIILAAVVRIKPVSKTNKSFRELIINRKDIALSLLILLSIYLLNYIRNIGNTDFNIRDLGLLTLFGSSESEKSLISWLSLSLVNTLPIFMVGLSKSRLKRYFNEPMLIRFKNSEDYKYNVKKIHFSYILIYLAAVILINYISFFIGKDSTLNTDYLKEAYGLVFDLGMLSEYNLGFAINLLFSFGIFYIISSFIGEVGAMIIIFLSKFILFFLASSDLLKVNYGIVNFFEDGGISWVIYIKLIAVLLYIGLTVLKHKRSYRYGSN